MNDEVLYDSSKEDIIEYCRSLDNCNASLSAICDTQQKMIKDLSKVVRGFNDIIKAEHEFDTAVRRLQRIENKMLDAYGDCAPKPFPEYKFDKDSIDIVEDIPNAVSDNQDTIPFKKVNDPPQGPKLDADTPTVSEALRSLGSAVEGCFG